MDNFSQFLSSSEENWSSFHEQNRWIKAAMVDSKISFIYLERMCAEMNSILFFSIEQ